MNSSQAMDTICTVTYFNNIITHTQINFIYSFRKENIKVYG